MTLKQFWIDPYQTTLDTHAAEHRTWKVDCFVRVDCGGTHLKSPSPAGEGLG